MRRAVLLIGLAGALFLGLALWVVRPQFTTRTAATAPGAHETSRTKADVNSASREELLSVPGMSPELAEEVIQHRPYRKLDDLVTRRVLGKKEFARIREHIVVRRGS